ncbi:MAG: amylo-alpha-1,6-glucosidase [Lentisphaeria bacterium]
MLTQTPSPESSNVFYQGDLLTFTLTDIPQNTEGEAFLRTSLGAGKILRQEIIDEVEKQTTPSGKEWHDLPMTCRNANTYTTTLPLHEVGFFYAKAYFLPKDTGMPIWPEGGNTKIKIEPAITFSQNNIYNAFVRQFGPHSSPPQKNEQEQKAIEYLDAKNYNVIPPSGTFLDLGKKLDFIIRDLGFRIIQLLPIQPTPTTYARMGRFGSPFAPRDFFSVDPALAIFDRKHTPSEQAQLLFQNIHSRKALVFLDIPIAHTGWASRLQNHHPEWFVRTEKGDFVSPGAWDVVWADLCKLDFSKRALWQYLADVFLQCCRQGVDGFRCDAGYMIPLKAWKYLTAKVRQQYPDTIFFLEGLGGDIEITKNLLQEGNLNWAYSELFQIYSSEDITKYAHFCQQFSDETGALVNFAETHDNDRLAARSKNWAALRTALSALFAPAGCFGIANGVEWLATEKIDVHEAPSLNWGATENLCAHLRSLNFLLRFHPAFQAKTKRLPLPDSTSKLAVALLRIPADPKFKVLAIINTSDTEATEYHWSPDSFSAPNNQYQDLLSSQTKTILPENNLLHLSLAPGEALCLSVIAIQKKEGPFPTLSSNHVQSYKALILNTIVATSSYHEISQQEFDHFFQLLIQSPRDFLAQLYTTGNYVPILEWLPESDSTRTTIIPPKHMLLIRYKKPFKAAIMFHGHCLGQKFSLPTPNTKFHFALFCHFPHTDKNETATLELLAYPSMSTARLKAPLLLCGKATSAQVSLHLSEHEIKPEHCGLLTTNLGGYSLCRAEWGKLYSSYDAMLAANFSDDVPVDRLIGLTHCKIWVIQHAFSHELNKTCQTDFCQITPEQLQWSFIIPGDMSQNIPIRVLLHLHKERNAISLQIIRDSPAAMEDCPFPCDKNSAVTITIRPIIDYRVNHNHTKAFVVAENHFIQSLVPQPDGFTFTPDPNTHLQATMNGAQYFQKPEWQYQYHHAIDAERGLEASGDLFSPGYFSSKLTPDKPIQLDTIIDANNKPPFLFPREDTIPAETPAMSGTPEQLLMQAMDCYICRRDKFHTVIAGYPWFLDWGRDTLICLRGMIAAGKEEISQEIIQQFASFEEKGTIPNMIRGKDVSNRETSDAPLWLLTAVNDFILAFPKNNILEADCGGKTLLEHLISIVEYYKDGTPNGIYMCPKTSLIFSPSHFTWMDTNYPAGSPRKGYPIEIQALWYAALTFLFKITKEERYQKRAMQVRSSCQKLYTKYPQIGLSDCLHASAGMSADIATPDDACRPNQLLAITLGLIQSQPIQQQILLACQHLLFPGGIRSIAKRPVTIPLEIKFHDKLLNDPLSPYCGQYLGDEDTHRKPAYHNGTGWGWQMPSYSEALIMTYGKSTAATARYFLESVRGELRSACLGHLSEIYDGDTPHTPRGCPAQAWSVSEFYRILKMLKND